MISIFQLNLHAKLSTKCTFVFQTTEKKKQNHVYYCMELRLLETHRISLENSDISGWFRDGQTNSHPEEPGGAAGDPRCTCDWFGARLCFPSEEKKRFQTATVMDMLSEYLYHRKQSYLVSFHSFVTV